MPCHPQIAQREQRDNLCCVFLEPSVAHLHVPKLLLEYSERMLHLGPDAGPGALQLVDQRLKWPVLVQSPAQTRV